MRSEPVSPSNVLRLAGADDPSAKEPDRLSALFHMVNRLLPEKQVVVWVTPETRLLPEKQIVVWVTPETSAREALALMRKHGFSQLPVVQGSTVLGLFRSREDLDRSRSRA